MRARVDLGMEARSAPSYGCAGLHSLRSQHAQLASPNCSSTSSSFISKHCETLYSSRPFDWCTSFPRVRVQPAVKAPLRFSPSFCLWPLLAWLLQVIASLRCIRTACDADHSWAPLPCEELQGVTLRVPDHGGCLAAMPGALLEGATACCLPTAHTY